MNKKVVISVLFLLILTGCSQKPEVDAGAASETPTSFIVEAKGDYKTISPLMPSPTNGITNGTETATLNLDKMEYGLMEIAKLFVDPNDFFYQPGQVLSQAETESLLNREYTDAQYKNEVKTNKDLLNIGINPLLNDGADPSTAPIYVDTLIEQDYYKLDENGNRKIDTIAIALGMDPTFEYNYKDKKQVKNIDDDELVNYASSYVANKVSEYIHSKEGYENVNIVYGFYKQSDSDSIPGHFISYGHVKGGDVSMDKYQPVDEEYVVFPSDRGKELNDKLNSDVIKLQTDIYTYFNYASGTSAMGYFEDGKITDLKISVIADIYSEVQAVPFVNFVISSCEPLKAYAIPINIEISRSNGDSVAVIQIDSSGTASKYIY